MEVLKISDYKTLKAKESEIIRRILAGEKELFEILVRRNNQKLYRVVRSYLNEEVEIEDIIQNAHIKAYEKLYQFKLSSTYSTWLIRIGINECLVRLREKSKTASIYKTVSEDETTRILELPDMKEVNPEQKIIREESKMLLEKSIDLLEPKYKIVYMLKEIEKMSLKDIAASLDLSISNVKVRIHRAKAILKENLFDLAKDTNLFEFGFSRCDRITEHVMQSIR